MSARAVGLLLLSLALTPACGDMSIPKPAEPQPIRADRIKPGTATRLKRGLYPGHRYETFRVVNMKHFAWTILDDIELSAMLPAGSVPSGRELVSEHHATLRCPVPAIISVGEEIEIPFDACVSTTERLEPGARVSGFRLVAREGYLESNLEPSLEMGRPIPNP